MTVLQNEAFTDPGATATDANGNSVPVVVGGEVDTRYPGSYTLIYTATDSNGKTATAERTVDVIAATGNITITVNGSASMTLTVGQNYYEEGADARNSSGEGVRDITISGNVDTNIPGTYVLTYTARDDSGNTATATRTVTVVARRAENEQSPTIRLIGESNIIVNIGETFTDPGAEATDVDGSPLVAYPSSNVNINTAGNYTISYEAISNVNGKSASISRNVYVFGSTDVSSLRPAFTLDGRPVIWDSNGNGWARGADGNRELVGQNGQLLPTAPFMNVSATEIDPRSLTPVPGHEGLYTDGINLYAFDQNGNPVLQGTLHDLRQLENLGPSTVVAPSGNQLSPVPGFVGVYTDGTNFYTLDENGNPVLQAPQIPVNPFSPNNPFVGQPTVAPPYVPPAPGGQQGSELTLPSNPYANLFGGQVLATVPSVISGEPIYQEILLPNGNRAWTTNGTDYFDGSNVYKYDPNVSTDLLWYNVATNKFEPSNIDRALSIAALDQSGDSTEPSEGTGKDKQGRSVANTARNLRTAASQAGETGKKTMNRVVGIFKKDDPTKPDILNLDPSRLKALAKIGVATGVSMVATPAGGMAAGYLMRDQSKWDRLVDWATNPDKIDRDGYVTFTNPDTGQKERWSKSDVQNMLAFLQAQGLKP
ncbi:MAG: DUF5011 domain-containing protein [Candidatus Doudnabacteria bacterium]|nr:DUF5011 domain-containing protein [Candidatus Doudnabacteria bacterium]